MLWREGQKIRIAKSYKHRLRIGWCSDGFMEIREKYLHLLLLSGSWPDQQINELLNLGPYVFHFLSLIQGGRKLDPTMWIYSSVLATAVAGQVTSCSWALMCRGVAESLPPIISCAFLRNNKKQKALGPVGLCVEKSCLLYYWGHFPTCC